MNFLSCWAKDNLIGKLILQYIKAKKKKKKKTKTKTKVKIKKLNQIEPN